MDLVDLFLHDMDWPYQLLTVGLILACAIGRTMAYVSVHHKHPPAPAGQNHPGDFSRPVDGPMSKKAPAKDNPGAPASSAQNSLTNDFQQPERLVQTMRLQDLAPDAQPRSVSA